MLSPLFGMLSGLCADSVQWHDSTLPKLAADGICSGSATMQGCSMMKHDCNTRSANRMQGSHGNRDKVTRYAVRHMTIREQWLWYASLASPAALHRQHADTVAALQHSRCRRQRCIAPPHRHRRAHPGAGPRRPPQQCVQRRGRLQGVPARPPAAAEQLHTACTSQELRQRRRRHRCRCCCCELPTMLSASAGHPSRLR